MISARLPLDSPTDDGDRSWKDLLRTTGYERFRSRLAAFPCARCPLHGERQRIVVDRGDAAASVFLVGEAPGAEEDRCGSAFVGAAGRLLDRLLYEAGIDPARDVLIANVVKCRPPGNRAPVKLEAEACRPLLERQIELVAPRHLVLLGSTAVRHVLRPEKRLPLGRIAGSFFTLERWPGVEILVTYHPSYVLRQRRVQPRVEEHLRELAERIQSRSPESIHER